LCTSPRYKALPELRDSATPAKRMPTAGTLSDRPQRSKAQGPKANTAPLHSAKVPMTKAPWAALAAKAATTSAE
jgi:hypothetical protein